MEIHRFNGKRIIGIEKVDDKQYTVYLDDGTLIHFWCDCCYITMSDEVVEK